MKKFFIIIFHFFIFLNFSYPYDTIPIRTFQTDTSFVVIHIPPNEKEIFKNTDYTSQTKFRYNPITVFLDYIIKIFFKNISHNEMEKIRQVVIWIIITLSGIILNRTLKKYGWGIPVLQNSRAGAKSSVFSDIDKPLQSYNFQQIIQKYISEGNFRMAFRWTFLQLIHEMEKKQILTFEPHKSIADLKNSIQKHTFYPEFSEACRAFEYVWYGEFSLTAETFRFLEKNINNLMLQITGS